jgi:hypothetical protein
MQNRKENIMSLYVLHAEKKFKLFVAFPVTTDVNRLMQRSPTAGPQATSGLRPLAKLFVNLLLVTTSSFIYFLYHEAF